MSLAEAADTGDVYGRPIELLDEVIECLPASTFTGFRRKIKRDIVVQNLNQVGCE